MKLTITHLKAPWPAGAKVGDVIDLPAVPSWAAGKCVPAADDAAVTAGEPAFVANVFPAADPEEAKIAAALREADEQAAQELAAMHARESKKRKGAR